MDHTLGPDARNESLDGAPVKNIQLMKVYRGSNVANIFEEVRTQDGAVEFNARLLKKKFCGMTSYKSINSGNQNAHCSSLLRHSFLEPFQIRIDHHCDQILKGDTRLPTQDLPGPP